MFSTITTALSTTIPKSTAPKERRLAEIPEEFIIVNEKRSANGIVATTTIEAFKLPIKKITTKLTTAIPSSKVVPTVLRVYFYQISTIVCVSNSCTFRHITIVNFFDLGANPFSKRVWFHPSSHSD